MRAKGIWAPMGTGREVSTVSEDRRTSQTTQEVPTFQQREGVEEDGSSWEG